MFGFEFQTPRQESLEEREERIHREIRRKGEVGYRPWWWECYGEKRCDCGVGIEQTQFEELPGDASMAGYECSGCGRRWRVYHEG